jgi:hypothetical protein
MLERKWFDGPDLQQWKLLAAFGETPNHFFLFAPVELPSEQIVKEIGHLVAERKARESQPVLSETSQKINALRRAIGDLPTSARVLKLDSTRFDLAYLRIGTVCRELFGDSTRLGVNWDGTDVTLEYPDRTLFVEVTEELRKLVA